MIVVVVSRIRYIDSVELYVKRRVQSSSKRPFLPVDHDAFGPVGQQHTLRRLTSSVHNSTTSKQTLVCDICMNEGLHLLQTFEYHAASYSSSSYRRFLCGPEFKGARSITAPGYCVWVPSWKRKDANCGRSAWQITPFVGYDKQESKGKVLSELFCI